MAGTGWLKRILRVFAIVLVTLLCGALLYWAIVLMDAPERNQQQEEPPRSSSTAAQWMEAENLIVSWRPGS